MIRVILRARLISLALFFIYFFITTSCFADFKFAVIGDTQGTISGINKKVLKRLMGQVKCDNPDFIVFVGDLTAGSKDNDRYIGMLEAWKEIVENYAIPMYISVGNRDIVSASSEEAFRSVFEMPQNGPAGFKELSYSFDYKNSHFIVIDTELYGDRHRIGNVQREWLERDLKENERDIVFVFGHEPAYPTEYHIGDSLDTYPSERDELWQIFVEYGVAIYFCGHEHLYESSLHNGVYQVITGGGGGLPRIPTLKGGFYHYMLVDVGDDGECGISAKNTDGNIKDYFRIKIPPIY